MSGSVSETCPEFSPILIAEIGDHLKPTVVREEIDRGASAKVQQSEDDLMDDRMQALIDAPLADPAKLYSPGGKRPYSRGPKAENGDIGCPKLTAKEVSERKQKAAAAKFEALFGYYASTDLTAEKIAERMGLYRMEQTGVDDARKPILSRVLDVEQVERQITWRRKAQAATD